MSNSNFSDASLWDHILHYLSEAGRALIKQVLILYYTFIDPNTPAWAKAIILPALAYFISPIDAIPDFIPVAGFTDDTGVIAGAIAAIAVSITPKIKKQAENKLKELFG